jgi:tetratricopeptide (TPR) repeat protein
MLLSAGGGPRARADGQPQVGGESRDEGESLPDRSLRQIVEKQRTILDDAAKQGQGLDDESLRVQLQEVCHEYELLLHDSPNFAAAYASYGYLLGKVDMRRESVAMLLKANQLDPNIPLVKNQIGNYLAEEGKPLEAINYFLSAIKLEPDEPLYHYQLGTLLYEARDDFLKAGAYTRPELDNAMHQAFKRAAELAPNRIEFTYRYAESFGDLEKPDWAGALKAWATLEESAPTRVERQTMRLQAANVLIKLGRFDQARVLIASVTEPDLERQKEKLIAQFPENEKK